MRRAHHGIDEEILRSDGAITVGVEECVQGRAARVGAREQVDRRHHEAVELPRAEGAALVGIGPCLQVARDPGGLVDLRGKEGREREEEGE